MVIVGCLIGRVGERILMAVGILIRAASPFMLDDLNLSMGMGSVIWPNIVNGFAGGFLFVPLATMSMKTLPNEPMGEPGCHAPTLRGCASCSSRCNSSTFSLAFASAFLPAAVIR